MAVFKLNICKFNNCDLVFNNLENLIRHIETNHINYDPKIIEQFETQQPTCLPLSYVLKFFVDLPIEEKPNSGHSKLKQTLLSPKTTQQISILDNNASDQQDTKNNNDDEKAESSVTLKTNSKVIKNVKVSTKTYKCHCGKTYGTSPSLRKHAIQCHNAAVITAQVKEILQQGPEVSNVKKVVQPYSSVALKQISASGTSLKTLVVSPKPTNGEINQSSQMVQQPQRLMTIQLSKLNTVST